MEINKSHTYKHDYYHYSCKQHTFLAFAAGVLPFFSLAAAALASFLAFIASAAVRGLDDAVFTTVTCLFLAVPFGAFFGAAA